MTYLETLQFLYSQLPMYQRIGSAAYKTDLNNTIELCKILDNPHQKFKSIHIAGTNGKGSVAHWLSAILQSAGFRTGLYTSPHLKDFRERIRINGEMIPEQTVSDFVSKYKTTLERINPSFFEYTVGMAFDYFAEKEVDIAVLETGMGGRLDSTNIVDPLLSVITQIGMDHTAFLGNSIPEIAREKAGIIKPNTPVVIGIDQDETREVFLEVAKAGNSPIRFAQSEFKVTNGKITESPPYLREVLVEDILQNTNYAFLSGLTGTYQAQNLPAVFSAIHDLVRQGFTISEDNIRTGIRDVVKLTGIRGRWEILGDDPLTICDSGHNEDGISAVVEQIRKMDWKKLHFVFGTVNDKEIGKILELLPKEARYYLCKANIPRALDENILKEQALASGLKGTSYPTVAEAFKTAKANSGENDLVFVGGSTFVVAEVL